MSNSAKRPPARPDADATVVTLADLDEARALYAQLDPAWFDEANDPEAWLFEPEVQKLIAEVVDAEIAPMAALLAPEELRVLREEMELACHTDPVTIEYLKRVRPRAPQDSSGKVRKGMFSEPAPAAQSKKVRGGKP